MAHQERPDESPGTDGKAHAGESENPAGKRDASGGSDTGSVAASPSPEPAVSRNPPVPGHDAGGVPGRSPAYESPAPGSALPESETDRGISGVLALWGPLIIIGFLVLVLGADDVRQAASRGERPASQEFAEATVRVGDPVPVAPAVAGDAIPAALGEAPDTVRAAAGTTDPVSAEGSDGTAPKREEVTEAALAPSEPAIETTDPEAATALTESPAADQGSSRSPPAGLDLAALLAAAGIALPPGVDETASSAAAAVEELSAPLAEEGASPPAPAPGAAVSADAGTVAPSAGGSPTLQPEASPATAMSANPWGAPAPSPPDVVWSSQAGSAAPGTLAPGTTGGFDWPPVAPETAPAPPDGTRETAPSWAGWPPRPILVPCAPPYYWCFALPIPVLVPTPPPAY